MGNYTEAVRMDNCATGFPEYASRNTISGPRANGCTFFARKYHNKDCVRTVLPWRLDGCNSSPHLALSRIASERCCPVIRTDAAVFPYLCLRRKSDFLLNSDERPDTLPQRPDAWLGHLGRSLGSDFSELESAQYLLWTSWSTFLKWRL
jgi:hypothetical protein